MDQGKHRQQSDKFEDNRGHRDIRIPFQPLVQPVHADHIKENGQTDDQKQGFRPASSAP